MPLIDPVPHFVDAMLRMRNELAQLEAQMAQEYDKPATCGPHDTASLTTMFDEVTLEAQHALKKELDILSTLDPNDTASLSRAVLVLLRYQNDSRPEGVPLYVLVKQFAPASMVDVKAAINMLVLSADAFTTVSDEHYAALVL